jgi:hypothetical protein
MKIYLSKSNKANPESIFEIKKLIADNKIELSEYIGGMYKPDVLFRDVEMVFQITHPDGEKNMPSKAYYGKGIYSEYIHAFKLGIPIYIYYKGKFYFVKEISINDPNDYMFNYAISFTNSIPLNLSDIIKTDDELYLEEDEEEMS